MYANLGDPLYNLWLFAKLAGQNLVVSFGLGTSDPSHILLPSQPLIDFQSKILTSLFSPAWTYNILIALGFILTFLASFLLVKKFGQSRLVALVCATIITFLPYRLIHSQYHISLSSTHWLLFSLYFVVSLYEKPNWKNMLGLGVFTTLTLLDNYQYGAFAVFCAITLVTLVIIKSYVQGKVGNLGKILFYGVLAAILSLSLLTVFDHQLIVSLTKDSGLTDLGPARKVFELSIYSARWFYYIAPSNLLEFFQRPFATLYNSQISTFKTTPEEQVLFMGWIPIILAGASLFFKKPREQKFKYFFISVLGLTALLLSFSPTINLFGHSFEAPSKMLYDHFPVVRVYARFGFLVDICCIILASFTLNQIVKKCKYYKLVLIAILLATLLEFAPKNILPIVKTNDVPSIYTELQKLEQGPIAEYPYFASDEPRGYLYLLAQLNHHFPLIYGSTVDSAGDTFRKSVLNPGKNSTITALKTIGVKYIIIHQDIYESFDSTRYPEVLNNGLIPMPPVSQTKLVTCAENSCLYTINY